MISVMVDLETLSLDTDTAIVSIGACAWDRTKETFSETTSLYQTVQLKDNNVKINHDTLWWWATQSEEVRHALNPKYAISMVQALTNLYAFYTRLNATEIWSKGADFDLAILKDAYSSFNLDAPWHYRHTRCFRTLEAFAGNITKLEFAGAHNAINDARHQAANCHLLMTRLKLW